MDQTYNQHGIKKPVPMTKSPVSNPGVVYQPANIPTNPGAFKVAQQTAKNLIFQAQNGGQVIVGSRNPSLPHFPGYPSVTILDNLGNVIAILAGGFIGDGTESNPDNVVVSETLQGNPQALVISGLQNPDRDTPISLVVISDNSKQEDTALEIDVSNASDGLFVTTDGTGVPISAENINGANVKPPLQISNAATVSTDFYPQISLTGNFINTIWQGDGTSPVGVLNGASGDILINGDSGKPYWCGGGTTWTLF